MKILEFQISKLKIKKFKLASYLSSKMVGSVRKTSLNTLRIQKKIACGGYFSPNPTCSLDPFHLRPSIAAPKAHFQSTPWLGRFLLICVSNSNCYTLVQLMSFYDANGFLLTAYRAVANFSMSHGEL